MSAAVGSIACTYVQGSPRGLLQRVQTWFMPGTNGVYALKLGINDSSFSFRCVLYDTLANVQAWKTNLEGAIGTSVTITDDQGTGWTKCLITDVRSDPRWRTPAINSGVSGVTTRGELVVSGVVTT